MHHYTANKLRHDATLQRSRSHYFTLPSLSLPSLYCCRLNNISFPHHQFSFSSVNVEYFFRLYIFCLFFIEGREEGKGEEQSTRGAGSCIWFARLPSVVDALRILGGGELIKPGILWDFSNILSPADWAFTKTPFSSLFYVLRHHLSRRNFLVRSPVYWGEKGTRCLVLQLSTRCRQYLPRTQSLQSVFWCFCPLLLCSVKRRHFILLC